MNHHLKKTTAAYIDQMSSKPEIAKNLSRTSNSVLKKESPKTLQNKKLEDPEFETLTTAEKLNDSKYRRQIYQTYPNEPTCKCESERAKKLPKNPTCPGGCTKKCCLRVRQTPKNKNVENLSHKDCNNERLRGGGGEGFGNSENNYNLFRTNQLRQNGGGESNCYSKNINYNRTLVPNDPQNCCCPDKAILDSVMQRRSEQSPIKKPCLGPDCLIKAFENAKEFVDSLGKVPGLPGLGLMDPGESPYFGRKYDDDDDDTETEESNNNSKTPPLVIQKINKNCCSEVCNTRNGNLSGVSLRHGVMKEYVPLSPNFSNSVIPGPKIKKKEKEAKADVSSISLVPEGTGPCGDPKCKSRKKKAQTEEEETGILKGSKNRINDENNQNFKDKDKINFHAKSKEEKKLRNSSGKLRRRIGKFVYSLGDSYPGVNCGHQNCKKQPDRVPANVGWLWKDQVPLGRLKPRIGWKPGAINSRLRQALQEVKGNFLPENKSTTSLSRAKKKLPMKKSRGFISAKQKKTEKIEEWKEPPPTLHIQRKDGVYYVTMYPIKDDKMDIPKLEEPTKPLQFKIMKNKDDISEVASSIASDMEIEFSPPAAVNRYRKKPDVIHVETQVKQQEIIDAYKPPGSKKAEKKSKKEKRAKK